MHKQVSPKITLIVVVLALAVVQAVYWRVLVYRPTMQGPGQMKGASMMMGGEQIPLGFREVTVTTIAGDNIPGYRDGAAIVGRFDGPSGIAADTSGNLFISDSRNHRIRQITPDGRLRTIAGSGETGTAFGGFADGQVDQARFSSPVGLAWVPDRGLYIADAGNHRIRLLTPQGVVRTIAGGSTSVGEDGKPNGGDQDSIGERARFLYPTAIAVDRAGIVYVADTGNHSIRKIDAIGNVTTLARLQSVQQIVWFPSEGQAKSPSKEGGDSPERLASKPTSGENVAAPVGILIDSAGRLLVADAGNQCLWEISQNGAQRMLVPPPRSISEGIDASHFLRPTGLTDDGSGRVYVTDAMTNCLLRWGPHEGITMIAGQFAPSFVGRYSDAPGDRAGFATPCAIARIGNILYVADFGNDCIRKISGIELGGKSQRPGINTGGPDFGP